MGNLVRRPGPASTETSWPWLPLHAPFSVKCVFSAGLDKSLVALGDHGVAERFSR